jgi:prevent-host-death family protein
MREIQASEAKTHLPQLLDAVERGETIVITRHGRAIARIVPEAEHRQAEIRTAIDGIKALRRNGAMLSVEEIHALIHDGRPD